MLHAFNTKNVRRILARQGDEHTNDKNEDAVTSMVFTPLAFMEVDAALACLDALLGEELRSSVGGRVAVRHDVALWPSGLRARGWANEEATRCEPDLLVTLHFKDGSRLPIVGEMKWDWRMSAEQLTHELQRERQAVHDQLKSRPLLFVTSKFPSPGTGLGVPWLTWRQVAAKISRLERHDRQAVRNWAELIGRFLQKADQMGFEGFRPAPVRPEWLRPYSFWGNG